MQFANALTLAMVLGNLNQIANQLGFLWTSYEPYAFFLKLLISVHTVFQRIEYVPRACCSTAMFHYSWPMQDESH